MAVLTQSIGERHVAGCDVDGQRLIEPQRRRSGEPEDDSGDDHEEDGDPSGGPGHRDGTLTRSSALPLDRHEGPSPCEEGRYAGRQ